MEAIAAAEAALQTLRATEAARLECDARSAAVAASARASDARAFELAEACREAEALVAQLSIRVSLLEQERAGSAAKAAELRVGFERELRLVEAEAAAYARYVGPCWLMNSA